MAKDFIDFELLEELSANDADVDLWKKAGKLTEEVGEFWQAFLVLKEAENLSKSALTANPKEAVMEELCDVLNVTLDLFNALNISSDSAKAMFTAKLRKWQSKQIEANKNKDLDFESMLEVVDIEDSGWGDGSYSITLSSAVFDHREQAEEFVEELRKKCDA